MNNVVSKFGGSSMANIEAMTRSAKIAIEKNSKVIVVSAVYETTDLLVELTQKAQNGDWQVCEEILFKIGQKHHKIANDINIHDETRAQLKELLSNLETLAKGIYLLKECSAIATDRVLSLGERMSSLLFTQLLAKMHTKTVKLLDAREVIKTDAKHTKATPIIEVIKQKAKEYIKDDIYVTQGFIGSSLTGAITTLGRGGSDYSASLFAEAIQSDLLEIWTDVAGIATTDPRICPNAVPIHEISYREASELAQYGAKVLHPTTLVPAIRGSIPVFVGSSYDSSQPGTWIKEHTQLRPTLRAITVRKNQALLIIRTPEMLNAYGFMERIFEVFRNHAISVDCVTTSEISVAITCDQSTVENEELIKDLKNLGEVKIEKNYSLISLIGNHIHSTAGLGVNIFKSIADINVRMICLGASEHNFCFIVDNHISDLAIQRLHKYFIERQQDERDEASTLR